MELIDFNLCKMNTLKRCPHCHEGVIVIAKHFRTDMIYYPCNDCLVIYKSYQDVVEDRPMDHHDARVLWESYGVGKFNAFIGAKEKDIRGVGIEIKENKLDFCYVCEAEGKSEWVLAMKNRKDGTLFCRCPSCRTEWENADDLYVRKPSFRHTSDYRDAFLCEIKEAGWYQEYHRFMPCFICNSGWIKVMRDRKSGKVLFRCDACNRTWNSPPDDSEYWRNHYDVDPMNENYCIPEKDDRDAMPFFHLKMFQEW